MRRLIIFDLDGVLVDTKRIHYDALNTSLKKIDKKFVISYEEHLRLYDALSTSQKLKLLTKYKKLPEKYWKTIYDEKQKETFKLLKKSVKNDIQLINFFKKLKKNKYNIAVASNSIRESLELILNQLGIIKFIEFSISNEDVNSPKPHPEMFWKCMIHFKTLPSETTIIEDSPRGRNAAQLSGANVITVNKRKDINDNFVKNFFGEKVKLKKLPWISRDLKILIPMAGLGSRFEQAGYTFPKPLIEVRGKPMIQVIVENLNIKGKFIFVVQKKHFEKYNLGHLLKLISPNCEIIQIEGLTEGAACTTLLAEKYINNNDPLLIANSDQFVEWDSSETIYSFINKEVDCGILTFPSTHPKWSYAKVNKRGFVTKVAEKKPISSHATVGIYYWKKGKDYVKYTKQMIKKNIRVNNEFYVCPVFNEAIGDNKKIVLSEIDREQMWGIGTPEDLDYFLKNYKGQI